MQALFKKEVVETFLRCVKMGYDQELAVIELNGLKIAEDRTFADCARYVFGSILDLCLPPPRHTKDDYHSLYHKTAPDVSTQVRSPMLMRLRGTCDNSASAAGQHADSSLMLVACLTTCYSENGSTPCNPVLLLQAINIYVWLAVAATPHWQHCLLYDSTDELMVATKAEHLG